MGNAAFFLDQLLELVSLQSGRIETFRTETIFQIVARKRQMTVAAAHSTGGLRQQFERGVGTGRHTSSVKRFGLALLGLLDDFVHFEDIGPSKYLGSWAVAVRFAKFFAVRPPSKGCLIYPVGEHDVVIALDRPQDLKPDEPRHFVHQPRSPGESFLDFFFKTR
jgi:hypothetical protein